MVNRIKKTVIFFWYILASSIILLAIIGVALKSLTPVLNHHKAYIEAYASKLLHVEIHIASIKAEWVRFGPEIHFKGISLREWGAQDKTLALQADELTIHISLFNTLYRKAIFFHSLALSGIKIVIRETAVDHYLINDVFSVDGSGHSTTQVPDFFAWLITQNSIHLANISLKLHRLNNSHFSMELNQANVYQSHQGLSIFLDGNVRAAVPGSKSQLKMFKSQVLLSTWVGLFKKKITFVEIKLLNRELVLQEGKKIRHYPRLEGVLLWQPVKENWLLQGKNLLLTKTSTASSDFSFELWQLPQHYAAHVNLLNLSDLAIFTDFFNLTPVGFDLKKANIQGALEDIDAIIPQDFTAINQYRFSAALRDVSSAAYQELPQMNHLCGSFSGSIAQGDFKLLDHEDNVYFANYFNQPIFINRLTASGQWHFVNDELSLTLNSIHATSPLAEVTAAMQLTLPLKNPSQAMLSLLATYNLKKSQAAVKLLPMKVFDADFSQWLTAALSDGAGGAGKVLIRGMIDRFPFTQKEGVFIVDGSVRPSTISFSPLWPEIKNISGRLLLHNQTLAIEILSGDQGITLKQAKIIVPDYVNQNVNLNIELQATGQAIDYLNYINHSPLNATLGQWLSPFDLAGSGDLSLHLKLPLNHLDSDSIKVAGQWLAQGVNFSWKTLNVGLKNIRGAINFTENSIQASNVSASLEKQALKFSINTVQEKGNIAAIEVDAVGEITLPQLKTLSHLDWLALYLVGHTHYRAHLRVPFTTSEYLMSFDTDLRGMKINLPQTFGKEVNTAVPLSLQASINPKADLLQFAVQYNKNFDMKMAVQHYSAPKIQPRTLQVDARVTTFAWPIIIPLPKISDSGSSPSFWSSLTTLNLHIIHLSLYNNNFSNVLFSGVRSPDKFSWKIQANEAQGNIVLPMDTKQAITANFDYLTLPALRNHEQTPATIAAASTADISATVAAAWPPFSVDIQQFKLGKINLGEAILQTEPLANGVKFLKIQLKNNLHRLSGQGQWVLEAGKEMTYLAGKFTTDNLGKFLSKNDITQNFQAKAGTIKYDFHWLGSPMKFQLKTLGGHAVIDVKNGVIPLGGDDAKMGLGKILTLFSTQSIQRRFQLNFSDLGENGYSFNSLQSVVHFQAGNAKVQQGTFDGPEAEIAFSGRVGLVQQDYDLYLIVTPYVTSSLPFIATLAGGPIAGVATYAFDKIVAGSIAKYTSYQYLLRGPWLQPQLISLDLVTEKTPMTKNIAPVEEARS